MAYVRKPKVFNVTFEEPHSLAGLNVKTKALSIKEFAAFGLKLADVAEVESAGSDSKKMKELQNLLSSVDEVREMFADALIEWNIEEEDGTVVPATLEGVQTLSDDEFFGIIAEWLQAIGGVDANLGKDSGSGAIFPELSDLMEPLSPSQAS